MEEDEQSAHMQEAVALSLEPAALAPSVGKEKLEGGAQGEAADESSVGEHPGKGLEPAGGFAGQSESEQATTVQNTSINTLQQLRPSPNLTTATPPRVSLNPADASFPSPSRSPSAPKPASKAPKASNAARPSSSTPPAPPVVDHRHIELLERIEQTILVDGPEAARTLLQNLGEVINVAEQTRAYEADETTNFEVVLRKPGGLQELIDASWTRYWAGGAVASQGRGKQKEGHAPKISPTLVEKGEDGRYALEGDPKIILHDGEVFAVAPDLPASKLYIQRPETDSSILTEVTAVLNTDCCFTLALSPCARKASFDAFFFANWTFFERGGTLVLITSTSELGQGAHTRATAWRNVIEARTSGRFAIMFVDALGDLQNFHIKAFLAVRASDGQVVDLTTSGNFTVRGHGSDAPFCKTAAELFASPRSIESLKQTTHARWEDGSGEGAQVIEAYGELVVWLAVKEKLVWALPALAKKHGGLDMDVVLGREVFEVLQTGLNDLASEQSLAQRQHKTRILLACKATALPSDSPSTNPKPRSSTNLPSASPIEQLDTNHQPSANSPSRPQVSQAKIQLLQGEFGLALAAAQPQGEVTEETRDLMKKRSEVREDAKRLVQENHPLLFSASERRAAAEHSSAAPKAKRATSSIPRPLGVPKKKKTSSAGAVKSRPFPAPRAEKRCPLDSGHVGVYQRWRDVLNHLTWAHSDDLLALDASAISNLPEALITEVREYIKKTKAQRKRVTSTAASTSEDERILCPKVGCQNRLGSFKTIGTLATHVAKSHGDDDELLRTLPAELKALVAEKATKSMTCPLCSRGNLYTSIDGLASHIILDHEEKYIEENDYKLSVGLIGAIRRRRTALATLRAKDD